MKKFDVMKRIEKVKGSIPEKFDLPGECLVTIKDNSGDKLDAAVNGYWIGFYLGGVAKEAELKEDVKNPKAIHEIRKAITASLYKNRNSIMLNNILKVAELLRKRMDNKEYKELTDIQREQAIAITNILRTNNTKCISCVNAFIRALES